MATVGNELQACFGGVLASLRAEVGLSQQALALECGLDRTYISLLERGLRQPTLATLFKLASVLETTPSAMVALVERALRS